MHQILIILTNFRHGGTNKSLENLLSLIDTTKYNVDVFAMDHFGPYKALLKNCTILPKDNLIDALISHWEDSKGLQRIRSFIVKILRKFLSYFNYNLTNRLFKNTANDLLKTKNYTSIIAYSEGVPTAFLSHVNHQNKIAWIHCDYSSYLKLNNYPNEQTIYDSYKSIICVSEYTKKVFIEIMPFFGKKVYSLHNMLNSNIIRIKSAESILDKKFISDFFTIITIGSFSKIKRLSIIPDIAIQLKERGCDFRWYVIASKGEISEFTRFTNKIKTNHIIDHVIFLGEKQNPYSYLKNSDLFVSLSITEACPYVINESKLLHIPIVCTDFPSASEFVENGKIGYITPIKSVVDKIELLIKNESIYKNIKYNILEYNYDNTKLLNKFYEIIEYDPIIK